MEHIPSNYEFSDFVKECKNRYNKIYTAVSIDQSIDIEEDLAKFIQRLKEKYGAEEVQKYGLYHALYSSPLSKMEIIADDLPGEDSIAGFIGELENKYKKG
ncbi:hypothetical protein KW796_00425 [Candidatus Parcubacteria bacterium]|nr:hypothetical protein [Candidatus Parcubacteria bacterium]